MKVKDNIELINSINSGMKIELITNEYEISNMVLEHDGNVYYNEVFDGKELIIDNINNLILEGSEKVSILAEPRYANVLTFKSCKELKLDNIIFGHNEEKGACRGGVLKFEDCENVVISNCKLFGCGTIGLNFKNCKSVQIENTEIYDCSEGIIKVFDTEALSISNSKFYDNEGFDFITVENSNEIEFSNIIIENNINKFYLEKKHNENYYLFNLLNSNIKIDKLTVNNNIIWAIAKEKDKNLFTDIDLSNNYCYSGSMFKENKVRYGNKLEKKINDYYSLIYDNKEIKVVREYKIDSGILSSPVISPNGSKMVYISPFEWEVFGDLHLCDLNDIKDNSSEIIISAEEISNKLGNGNKIKEVTWLNDEELILIIGYGYGTVSVGGNLYKYNYIKNELNELYKCESGTEVRNCTVDKGVVNIAIAVFDANRVVSNYKFDKVKI